MLTQHEVEENAVRSLDFICIRWHRMTRHTCQHPQTEGKGRTNLS